MKKTRLLTTAVLLCFAASLFTGCNSPADESAEVSRIGGGQGLYATYYYPSFYIQTYEENDGEIVAFVVITDGLVDCGGVRVGDTLDAVKQVYGTPAEEDDFGITYRSGYVDLHFVTDGVNTVTEIQYQDNNQ